MSTHVDKQQNELPTCIVCDKQFKRPSTLACGHTTCRACLTKLKKTQKDPKSIRCPNCNKGTKRTDPDSFLQLDNVRILKEEFDPNCTATLDATIDVKIETDERNPDPVDVTVLDVDGVVTVVVTDGDNACVKSFYTKEHLTRHSSVKLTSRPWSVKQLGNNQVVVSFSNKDELVILDVTPDLVLLSTITTQKKYGCLAALDDSKLVGGCYNPPSLDILDMTGQVLRSVPPAVEMLTPWFLATTSDGNILVSDVGTYSLSSLTPDGDVVFNYTPTGSKALIDPRGITTSSTEYILLAKKYRVILLTLEGKFVRNILTTQDGVQSPMGVCLYRDVRLYVVEARQAIKVFCVSKTKVKSTK